MGKGNDLALSAGPVGAGAKPKAADRVKNALKRLREQNADNASNGVGAAKKKTTEKRLLIDALPRAPSSGPRPSGGVGNN